jgi:hypothetical protein
MRPVPLVLLALAALLAACATPAQRVERALVAEGVPPAMARCMGERLDDRLSTTELRRLGRVAARVADTDPRRLTLGEIETLARDLGEPRLIGALASASVACLGRR